jgi:hypothetical protein
VHRTVDSEAAAIPDVSVHAAVESHLSSLGDQKLAVTGAVDRCEDTLGNDYVRDRAVSREPGRDSRAKSCPPGARGEGFQGSLVGLAPDYIVPAIAALRGRSDNTHLAGGLLRAGVKEIE